MAGSWSRSERTRTPVGGPARRWRRPPPRPSRTGGNRPGGSPPAPTPCAEFAPDLPYRVALRAGPCCSALLAATTLRRPASPPTHEPRCGPRAIAPGSVTVVGLVVLGLAAGWWGVAGGAVGAGARLLARRRVSPAAAALVGSLPLVAGSGFYWVRPLGSADGWAGRSWLLRCWWRWRWARSAGGRRRPAEVSEPLARPLHGSVEKLGDQQARQGEPEQLQGPRLRTGNVRQSATSSSRTRWTQNTPYDRCPTWRGIGCDRARAKRPSAGANTPGSTTKPATAAYSRFLVIAAPRVGGVRSAGPATGVEATTNRAAAAVQHRPGSSRAPGRPRRAGPAPRGGSRHLAGGQHQADAEPGEVRRQPQPRHAASLSNRPARSMIHATFRAARPSTSIPSRVQDGGPPRRRDNAQPHHPGEHR